MSGGELSMNQGANSRKSLQTAGVPMINSFHEKDQGVKFRRIPVSIVTGDMPKI